VYDTLRSVPLSELALGLSIDDCVRVVIETKPALAAEAPASVDSVPEMINDVELVAQDSRARRDIPFCLGRVECAVDRRFRAGGGSIDSSRVRTAPRTGIPEPHVADVAA
jgi:hypothetical protein